MAEFVTFLPYFLIDLGLIHVTLKYGPREWGNALLVKRNLPLIVFLGSAMMLAAHWSFVEMFNDFTQASFWSGYACQIIVSWSAIAQLVSRGNTRGHTMGIWLALPSESQYRIFTLTRRCTGAAAFSEHCALLRCFNGVLGITQRITATFTPH